MIALDAASGTVLWERVAYDGVMFANRHRRASYASATPLTDGQRVSVHVGAGTPAR